MWSANQCQFAGDVVEKGGKRAQVERTSHIQQTESQADGSDKEKNPRRLAQNPDFVMLANRKVRTAWLCLSTLRLCAGWRM
jgi:hypothetical protein